MSYGDTNCIDNTFKVSGFDGCETDLTASRKLALHLDTFQFDTEADAKDESKWEDAQQAESMWILPKVVQVDDASEETQIEEAALGDRFLTREGKRIVTYWCAVPLCVHKRLRTFNGSSVLRLITIDKNKNIVGTTPDDAIFEGRKIDFIHVGKMSESDGSVVRKTPIYIVEEYPAELDDYGAAFKVSGWNPLSLEGLKGVAVATSGTPTALELIVEVKSTCGGAGVTGLVEADFTVLDASGAAQTVGSFTEDGDGVYTFTGTAFVTGTVDLVTPATMTTKGYKSDGVASFTIT